MALIDRVDFLDPRGGPYRLGSIRAEAVIQPDDWFMVCHFVDDRVMPGTLMYEGCLHALRILVTRMGWIGRRGQVNFEPLPGSAIRLKCRGQVVETSSNVAYEVTIKERRISTAAVRHCRRTHIGGRQADRRDHGRGPAAFRDRQAGAGETLGSRRGGWIRSATTWTRAEEGGPPALVVLQSSIGVSENRRPSVAPWAGSAGPRPEAGESRQQPDTGAKKEGHSFWTPMSCSTTTGSSRSRLGSLPKPSASLTVRLTTGGFWRGFPGRPTSFLIGSCTPTPSPGSWPQDARPRPSLTSIPTRGFSRPIARKCCRWPSRSKPRCKRAAGWLRTWARHDTAMRTSSFATWADAACQHRSVRRDAGTLRTRVKVTKITRAAGMILQFFDFEVRSGDQLVYDGVAEFGFFPFRSLEEQVGIRDAVPHVLSAAERARARAFPYPTGSPYPDDRWRMIDRVDEMVEDGGPHGLGFVRGSTRWSTPSDGSFRRIFSTTRYGRVRSASSHCFSF